MKPVVFLGPSLPLVKAQAVLDAQYRPPVEQGQIYDAVKDEQPNLIIIIDGAFGGVPAVRHKEILYAVSRGVEVIGAASLGALRAAELQGRGMVGHGFIYRWYRRTVLADDDEVAVAMAPAELGSGALSEALINMRVTLRRAERDGVLGWELRQRLIEIARQIYFLDRSYQALLLRSREVLPRGLSAGLDQLEAWLPGRSVDQKGEDARSVLSLAASWKPGPRKGNAPENFVWTEAFVRDLEAFTRHGAKAGAVKRQR
ncbi:MAG TPA: TfuA-like protein [Microvirga sp.]|jgi:hypothetical protein|nr:TfuA-like protein [Microvirga sp.]